MGEVWEAHDAHDNLVALKRMRPELSKESRSRFIREAHLLARLQHPHIVGIRDVFEEEDDVVLVMERLQGETLRARLARGPLSIEETSRVAEQALSALVAIHTQGIVHRDLKPDNIYLVDTPGGFDLRLLDFGIASVKRLDNLTVTDLTRSGALVGTPMYMSPEQIFGERVDARTDLWSLGVILYTCVHGACPTHDDALGGIIRRITKNRIAPLASVAPHVPPALGMFVDALLEQERDNRPPSAAACLYALEPNAKIDATVDMTLVQAQDPKPARRAHPIWLVAAVALTAAVVVLGWLIARSAATPREPETTEPPAPVETAVATPEGVTTVTTLPETAATTPTPNTLPTKPTPTVTKTLAPPRPRAPKPVTGPSARPAVEDIVVP